jgi:hypothetical protein
MAIWDFLNSIAGHLPSVAVGFFLIIVFVAIGMFIAGFNKYGLSFIKYGSNQKDTADLGEKIDGLRAEIHAELKEIHTEMEGFHTEMEGFRTELGGFRTELGGFRAEMEGFRTELKTIKVNHFGHLKNYLGVLNGILLDKKVIDNESKARLDNELHGM